MKKKSGPKISHYMVGVGMITKKKPAVLAHRHYSDKISRSARETA